MLVRDYNDSASGTKISGQKLEPFLLRGDVDPLAIVNEPQNFLDIDGTPLPAVRSPHPLNSLYLLDSYDVDRSGVVSKVVAKYSTDGRFGPGPGDEGPDTNVILGYSSRRADVVTDIPYGKRIDSVTWFPVPPGQSGPPLLNVVRAWKLATYRVRESRRTRSYKVLIKYSEINAAEQVMDEQNDRLHKILGTWYRYQSSDVTPTGMKKDGQELYELEHSWERDTGTPWPDPVPNGFDWDPNSPNPITGIIEGWSAGLSGLFPLPNGSYWARPPFHIVHARPKDDIFNPPEFTLVLPYQRDDEGWRNLPGLNL